MGFGLALLVAQILPREVGGGATPPVHCLVCALRGADHPQGLSRPRRRRAVRQADVSLRFGKGATCLVSLVALSLGDVLILVFLRPPLLLAVLVQGFVLAVASRLRALWRATESRAEQVAIGIGARTGNGLLLTMLAWLVLSGQGASVDERSALALVLTSAFALSFVALVSRPDEAVIGYKG